MDDHKDVARQLRDFAGADIKGHTLDHDEQITVWEEISREAAVAIERLTKERDEARAALKRLSS